MNNEAMKEVLNELFSHLERLETQSEAILQFLKEKKRVTDKQLAPYLEQAGNAANVKWRAARVRIDRLLSEHEEEEIKLGKRPEVQEDSPSQSSSVDKKSKLDGKEDKRAEPVDEESKRTESGDQKQMESSDPHAKKSEPSDGEASGTDLSKKEKPLPVEAAPARPADGRQNEQEKRSESKPRNTEQATQDQRAQKSGSDDFHHPMEDTEPLARQEGAEPAAQLKPEKTNSGKEAA